MALSKNQPRRGHLRDVSGPEPKSARDSFLKKNQDERGYQHGVSGPADTRKDTRPVPKTTQPKRGSMAIADGDGAGSVKSISTEDKPDTIRSI